MTQHFCTCPDARCSKHPLNHDLGCDPCVKSNLRQKRMPSCFFQTVHDDVSGVTDYSIAGFVDFFLAHSDERSRGGER